MTTSTNVLIVGGGQAGLQTAVTLRELKYSGTITIVGDEPYLPYQRPPLSKSFLAAGSQPSTLALKPSTFYEVHNVHTILNQRVANLCLNERRAVLETGTTISYDELVLATGTRNRVLTVPGSDLTGVHYLRSLDDAMAVRHKLSASRKMVIVGGGFIGLEIGSFARSLGVDVTILEGAGRLAARAVCLDTSERLLENQAKLGSKVLFGASVTEFTGYKSAVSGVVLGDGRQFEADIVLVCIGVLPNTELASAAGLSVANGIVVDQSLRATDGRTFAIGDCANFTCAYFGAGSRLESVPNAIEQAKSVARTIMGTATAYKSLPWFWSDQGKLKLQMVGPTSQAGTVVTKADELGVVNYCFNNHKLVGVECINKPSEFVWSRKLLSLPTSVETADLEGVNFNLKQLVESMQQATVSANQ